MTKVLTSKTTTSFGYQPAEKEVGFYVVCSDRMILDNINSLMRKRGLLGISDTAGRVHYMVDARRGVPSVVNRITGQALKQLDYSSLSNAQIIVAVDEVMQRHGLDTVLLGTRICRYILIQSTRDVSLMSSVTKRAYGLTAAEFGMTPTQVERNLRYAFRKLQIYQDGRRNAYILNKLFSELRDYIVERYDCVPYPTDMLL
ncbi:MAG TPA: hypothetical protein GXZ67_09725 [Clostridiaceae bacterium]|nr:hypothetical protein [Clostridiaceae bacterium]